MPLHKDFEIWYDEKTERYRFSVEYWGSYGAKTKEEIQQKAKHIKSAVADRLKDIEKENQEYYARLAQEEERLKKELKEYKEHMKSKDCIRYCDLTKEQRAALLKMIEKGLGELEIKSKFDVNSQTIAALRQKRKNNALKNI